MLSTKDLVFQIKANKRNTLCFGVVSSTRREHEWKLIEQDDSDIRGWMAEIEKICHADDPYGGLGEIPDTDDSRAALAAAGFPLSLINELLPIVEVDVRQEAKTGI
ncbi:MAG: hypothetical protein IPM79_09965 [Polyangiaceae bacterium]|nr:hypothetical protein [Polyangiaceae bacterium]